MKISTCFVLCLFFFEHNGEKNPIGVMSAKALPPKIPYLVAAKEEKKAGPHYIQPVVGPNENDKKGIDKILPLFESVFMHIHVQLFEHAILSDNGKQLTIQFNVCPADVPFETILHCWYQWHLNQKCELDCQLFGISVTTGVWGITVKANTPQSDTLKKMVLSRQQQLTQVINRFEVLNSLLEKYENLFDHRICPICFNRESNVMFSPCNHVSICSLCVVNPICCKICPRCSQAVTKYDILKFAV